MRLETKTEREQRELRESVEQAKRQVNHLNDRRCSLMLRETEIIDGTAAAVKQIAQNEHSLELTRKRLKGVEQELVTARETLARRERVLDASK
jgi:hypothetical protein